MDGPPKSRQATTNSPWGMFDSLEIGVAVTHPDGTLRVLQRFATSAGDAKHRDTAGFVDF